MAYDLHIVRTKDWTRAASAPIAKEEVDSLIVADAELAWFTTDYVDMVEAGASTRYYMITWRGEPCFWWYRNQVKCAGPSEAQVSKLLQMARILNAQVVGDDGEVYPLEQQTSSTGKLAPSKAQRWPFWKQLLAAFLMGCILLVLKLLIFGS